MPLLDLSLVRAFPAPTPPSRGTPRNELALKPFAFALARGAPSLSLTLLVHIRTCSAQLDKWRCALSTKTAIVGRITEVLGVLSGFHGSEKLISNGRSGTGFRGRRHPVAPRVLRRSPLDARILALSDDEESPFLRGQKRVPVRRGALPRKAAGWLKMIFLWRWPWASSVCSGWRFTPTPPAPGASASIPATTSTWSGTRNIPRGQVLDVMGADLDRNIFFVPLTCARSNWSRCPGCSRRR